MRWILIEGPTKLIVSCNISLPLPVNWVTIRSWKKKGFYELRVSYKHNNSSINYNDFSKNLKILQNFLISKTHMFVIDPLILIYWIHYKYYSGNFFWSLFKHRKIPSRISNIQCSEKYNNIFFLLTDISFMYFFSKKK